MNPADRSEPGQGSGRARAGGAASGRHGRSRVSPAERREERAAETDPAAVLAAAARFLETRPRSLAEVRRRLRGAGYRLELIDGALERLEELGFVDDEAFARSWVESRDRAHPRGERALRSELGQKGVSRDIVDSVLEARRADADEPDGDPLDAEDAAAERLLARRSGSLARVADPRVRRQRAYGLLARNGFSPEVAARVSRGFATDSPSVDPGDDQP